MGKVADALSAKAALDAEPFGAQVERIERARIGLRGIGGQIINLGAEYCNLIAEAEDAADIAVFQQRRDDAVASVKADFAALDQDVQDIINGVLQDLLP